MSNTLQAQRSPAMRQVHPLNSMLPTAPKLLTRPRLGPRAAPALPERCSPSHRLGRGALLVPGSAGLQGPLDPHEAGASRSFRRQTKGLLKKGGGDAGSEQASAGPVATSAAVAAATAVVEEVVLEQQQHREALMAANNIVPAGQLYQTNNLSKNRALVLDCAYRPINVISWPKAVMMDWTQKAEVVEYYPLPATAVSGNGPHLLPAVVRVAAYVDLNEVASEVACTRRNIMVRDKFTCQYCGCGGKDLTLDHILPASKGGRNSWLNLVTACMSCNQRKGDKLLQNLGWRLRSTPRKPSPWEIGLVVGLSTSDIERPPAEWEPYVEPYRQKIQDIRRRAHMAGVGSESDNDN